MSLFSFDLKAHRAKFKEVVVTRTNGRYWCLFNGGNNGLPWCFFLERPLYNDYYKCDGFIPLEGADSKTYPEQVPQGTNRIIGGTIIRSRFGTEGGQGDG